jgi:hypothetical protein
MILALWNHILALGREHGVNPWVFGVLYLLHHPLFWGTIAWLAARVRQRRRVGGVIVLAVFFWFMPYLYIFFFGRALPWWVYALVLLLIALGAPHVLKEIRRRLHPHRQ